MCSRCRVCGVCEHRLGGRLKLDHTRDLLLQLHHLLHHLLLLLLLGELLLLHHLLLLLLLLQQDLQLVLPVQH